MRTQLRTLAESRLRIVGSAIAVAMLLMAVVLQWGGGPAHAAGTLPLGTWTINGNGSQGTLSITAVDATGKLTGTVYGQTISGFWDEASQSITFMRQVGTTSATVQVFTGYLFSNCASNTCTYTLAGSFMAFTPTGGTAARHEFGWYARIGVIG
jgi:hypothetical protein